jgi:hypothetical protein
MAYLQTLKTLLDSDVLMDLSYPAHKILRLAERKHMAFWTPNKAMVIFGLSYDEMIKTCHVTRKSIAPALRELREAGLLVLVRKGFHNRQNKLGAVSQFRLSMIDKDRKFGGRAA